MKKRLAEYTCDSCGEMLIVNDGGTNPPKGWLVVSLFSTTGEGGVAPAFSNNEFAFCGKCQRNKEALALKLAALIQGGKK